jgi:AraC-like DNA-binding protein
LCDIQFEGRIRRFENQDGIEFLDAWFSGNAYENHCHSTYAIGVTDSGLQSYDYRGATRISTPGSVMVLHPDELHNGRAGSDVGFGYRMIYIDPALISEAVRQITGHPCPLPFIKETVSHNPLIYAAVALASASDSFDKDSLVADEITLMLANGLIAADKQCINPKRLAHLNFSAVEDVREYLNVNLTRVVRSSELEKLSGMTRYELSRQFRKIVGTSPYRYSVNRRVAQAKSLLALQQRSLDIAFELGFSDQAHFIRTFKSTVGITPGKFQLLHHSLFVSIN